MRKLLLDYEKVKNKIYFCLMNNDSNKNILKEIPHRRFLDLAVTYKVLIAAGTFGVINANINNSLLKEWNVTEEDLFNLAVVNTPRLYKFETHDIFDMIDEYKDDIEEIFQEKIPEFMADENKMIIVTNMINHLGSHVFLYQEYIREILRKNNARKAYILPSSIHEIILLLEEPEKRLHNVLELMGMVQEVNKKMVADEEVLSNSVYEITLTDDISIAASTRPWKGGWDY